MKETSIIGLDLAKNVFQAHGAAADGLVVNKWPGFLGHVRVAKGPRHRDITVEEVARTLGVGPTTLYRRLPGGRSAVLEAVA